MENYEERLNELFQMSKDELKQLAKKYKLKRYSKLSKENLARQIIKVEEEEIQFQALLLLGDSGTPTEKPLDSKEKVKEPQIEFNTLEELWEFIRNIPDTELPKSIEELGINKKDTKRLAKRKLLKLGKEKEYIHKIFRNKEYTDIIPRKIKRTPTPLNFPNQIQVRCPTCHFPWNHPDPLIELENFENRFSGPVEFKEDANYILWHRGGQKKGGKLIKGKIIGMFHTCKPELPLMEKWNYKMQGRGKIQELESEIITLREKLSKLKGLKHPAILKSYFIPGELIHLDSFIQLLYKTINHYLRDNIEWAYPILYVNDMLLLGKLYQGKRTEIALDREEGQIGTLHYHPINTRKRNITYEDAYMMVRQRNLLDSICYTNIDKKNRIKEVVIKFYFLDYGDFPLLETLMGNKVAFFQGFQQRVRIHKIVYQKNDWKKKDFNLTVPQQKIIQHYELYDKRVAYEQLKIELIQKLSEDFLSQILDREIEQVLLHLKFKIQGDQIFLDLSPDPHLIHHVFDLNLLKIRYNVKCKLEPIKIDAKIVGNSQKKEIEDLLFPSAILGEDLHIKIKFSTL